MFRRFGAVPGEGDDADGFASQPGVGPCPFIGKIETIAGTCTLIRAGRVFIDIKVGDPVCRGDVVKTAADGRIGIRFVDGTAFSLSNNARMMLREFACGGDSPAALFDVTRGAFAFIAGEMAKAGHLGIDTPVANIRGRTRTGGVGTLTLSALIFAVMEEARAESPGDAFLDDGTITYNGVFELVTKEAHPRHILVDNPAETIVLHRIGSSIAADQIFNTAAQMAQLQAAQQDALHVFALGLAQGPTATGPGGSGAPPLFEIPSFFPQPINFTPPPDNTPQPPGPTGPGPNIPTPPPIFLDVIFTPPPAGPGKINEIPGHTDDKTTVDSTTGAVGLSFGTATLNGPTFVWSNGSLTDAQKSDLTAASQLTLSNSGGSVEFTYGAADHTFDFLAQGETLTVTYDVTVGGVTKQAIITVTGTNDTPAITSADSAESKAITEASNTSQPNPTGSSTPDTANGAVTFTDVDLSDHHHVTITGFVASGTTSGLDQAAAANWLTLGTLTDTTGSGLGGSQPWSFAAADKNFDYLAAGETLTLTYAVQVDDHNGGGVTQDVTITVTGTNDTPMITSGAQSGAITEETSLHQPNPTGSTTPDTANGAVTFTDVDLSDHHQVTVTGVVASGVTTGLANNATQLTWLTLGTLTDTTGTGLGGSQPWNFEAQDKNFDYLAAGEKLTLTYTVQVDDGQGGTVSQDVVITVTGTNDTPTIATTSNLAPLITEVPIPDPLPPGSDTAAVQEIAPAMSVDGRWVVFFSDEQLPNSGNSSDKGDVYLYDRLTDTTTVLTDDAHIPVKQPGELFSGFSISDDGGAVVFRGKYETGNLPGNGPSNVSLIYVYDRTTDTSSVLTNPATNTPFNVNDEPRIAHNQIVFASTDFGNNTTPPTYHIYVTDLSGNIQTDILPGTVGITEPVNPDDAIQFQQPDISGNGRYVTFWTVENVFDPNTNTESQVGNATLYTYDRTTGSYQTIATTSGSDGNNWWASMSNDGRYVVFQSNSDALDAQAGGHANGHMDIFVWDRSTGDITGITENATVHSDGASLRPSISANGDEIIFASDAANLVPGDTNGLGDTFVYDTQNHTFQRLSVAGDGTQGNGDSTLGSDLSFDGTFAAFGSTASNLVPGDTNVTSDIFIVDRSGGGVTGAVTEQPGTNNPGDDTVTGTITFTDVDLSDHHMVTVTGVSASGVTSGLPDNATILDWVSLGTLTDTTGSGLGGSQPWSFAAADKNFDYLAAGETLTLTYTVQVDDHNGGVVTQDVTITVTGTNDTPMITSGAQSGAITEETSLHQPNPTGSSDPDKASGAVTFTDVDLSDHHQVTVTGVLASGVTTGLADTSTQLGWLTLGTLTDTTGTGLGGSQPWAFSAKDQNFDYLAAGEKLTLTYTVKVDDGNGGSTSQDVVITVTGTNDTPVIAVASGDSAAATLTESYKTLSTAGTLTVTDADLSDTVTATVTGVTLGGTKGELTSADVLGMLSVTSGSIAANPADTNDLGWNFNSTPQTFNFLDAGESLMLTYTVQVSDGHGGITNQAVTITIDGANQPDLVTSFTGVDSHGYVGEHTPVTVHVSDGGVDVTSHATYQWQVLEPGHFGQPSHWVTVSNSNSNSFSQAETYEGEQLRVTTSYTEAGGTDSITTYLGQISDNDSDDHNASVRIQNLPNDLLVANGAALELAAATALAVFFPSTAGAYGELVIDHATSYTGQIHNFTGTSTQSDAIDLKDISYGSNITFAYHDNGVSNDHTGGTLTIFSTVNGHTTVADTITFANGDYTTANFTLLSDGHGGTLIVDPPSSATISGASAALTTGIDTLTFDNGTHQVSGTDQTVNNGDTLAGGAGTNTLTVDSGNGDHNYTFGDGNHTDIGLTNFAKLALTDANATTADAVTVTFDSSFHNNGTLTVDGSALTHLNGTNLTVDAHLAASDSFVIIGSANADTLIGGSNGNNTITGGGGGDVLTGNGANDTFVYKFTTDSQPGTGHFDTITNFTHTSDHFDFSAISGLNSAVQGVTFNSLSGAPDSLAAHTIDIVTSGGNTVVYANASGATETLAHVDMEIHVNNATNVHAADFILHA